MYKVRKRDGKIVPFEIEKIKDAIKLAFDAEKTNYDENVIDFIALKVTAAFAPEVKNNIIDVETIQDNVEKVLSQAGYTEVAKAYILYRKLHEKQRNMASRQHLL
jgi:ribonucleoside-triphosphate reductase